MNEIREAAMAHYLNMPENIHQKARSLFQSMDKDGDGKISRNEFWTSFKQLGVSFKDLDPKLFVELDENGDETLDFEEFVSLFYIVRSQRLKYCDGCQHFLKGLYFTCFTCFDQGHTNVNYCTACYRDRRHKNHHHLTFVDNYALLRFWSGQTYDTAKATQSVSSQPDQPIKAQYGSSQFVQTQPAKSQRRKEQIADFVAGLAGLALNEAFEPIIEEALGQGVAAVAVAAGCSIM